MYKNHDFVNMYRPLFQEVGQIIREKRRETKNGSFALNANRAVFLTLFHGKEIADIGQIRLKMRPWFSPYKSMITNHFNVPAINMTINEMMVLRTIAFRVAGLLRNLMNLLNEFMDCAPPLF